MKMMHVNLDDEKYVYKKRTTKEKKESDKLQSVTKYENFKKSLKNPPSPPMQCCEPIT